MYWKPYCWHILVDMSVCHMSLYFPCTTVLRFPTAFILEWRWLSVYVLQSSSHPVSCHYNKFSSCTSKREGKKSFFFSKANKPTKKPNPTPHPLNPQNKQRKQNHKQIQTITQTTRNSTSHNLVNSVLLWDIDLYPFSHSERNSK